MYQLFNNETGELIGEITEVQLQFLKEQLEEESLEDKDYEIEGMTLAYFEEQGIDGQLLAMLRKALADKDYIIIRWS
jgi:hypothetical protein